MVKSAFGESEFGKLSWKDFYNSIYFSLITVIDDLAELVFAGESLEWHDLKSSGGTFLFLIVLKFFTKGKESK